jgi:hypothetical protein
LKIDIRALDLAKKLIFEDSMLAKTPMDALR